MSLIRRVAVVLVAFAVTGVGCSSSAGGGSAITCVPEGDGGSGAQCLCMFGQVGAGQQVVKDCSTAAFKGSICCARNGWPSNASGAAICECATYNTSCTTPVDSCSAGTAPRDGG